MEFKCGSLGILRYWGVGGVPRVYNYVSCQSVVTT